MDDQVSREAPLLHATLADARAREPAPGERSVQMFKHGTASVKYYAPRDVDRQQPHDQDELYIVIRGTGVFVCGEDQTRLEPSDILFAPAGAPHRFEEFTDDFDVWAIFYGLTRGDSPM